MYFVIGWLISIWFDLVPPHHLPWNELHKTIGFIFDAVPAWHHFLLNLLLIGSKIILSFRISQRECLIELPSAIQFQRTQGASFFSLTLWKPRTIILWIGIYEVMRVRCLKLRTSQMNCLYHIRCKLFNDWLFLQSKSEVWFLELTHRHFWIL